MRISFLCGAGGPHYEWADPDVEHGIGGSEECLIYLARALARRGHTVHVFNNCGEKAGLYHGVIYCPFAVESYLGEDVLVAWRNWHLLVGKNASRKWMWSHDQPVYCHAPQGEAEIELALGEVDKFVLLNKSHAARYHMLPEERKLILSIGVNTADFARSDVERVPGRVLYFSEPARGLNELRKMWREVKWNVPHAELAAFWWDENKFLPALDDLSILPMRHLGPREIAEECLRASVFGYPCQFDGEISPATTIKAQIGGAVPCVIVRGGMVDTIRYGVKTDMNRFANDLSALLLDEGKQDDIRSEMIPAMRSYYDWDAVAAMWEAAMVA